MKVGINTKCPHRSPGITKNPRYGHLVFILFSQVLKKASASRRQNAPTVPHIAGSHVQWFVRSIRFIRFAYFAVLRSFVCACRSRASHRYTRLALRAMLASLTLIRFAASFAHSFHSFHVRPLFTCFPHMSSFLLAISTIRVASQWDK